MLDNNKRKWSIEDGDYKRDFRSTKRFLKTKTRKDFVHNVIIISIYAVVIAVLTYFIWFY